MTRVDQFESVFRSASKEICRPTAVELGHVSIVNDLRGEAAGEFDRSVRGFLAVLGDQVVWTDAEHDEARDLGRFLASVEAEQPDLICTYRNLFSDSWRYPYSLGEHVDVLTQAAHCPVLVLPHPRVESSAEFAAHGTKHVLAMGGHLAGDHSLVDWALRMTQPGGTLRIAHIEDDQSFERYAEAISKIPSIETEDARETIIAQLLKEPREYIESVSHALVEAGSDIRVEGEVQLGHRLSEYRRLIDEHRVDLLVMHTKDEDQLAMHGLAYPLAVELRETPLLLL